MHLVNWDMVTLPKSQGALGVCMSEDRNLALSRNFAWRDREKVSPRARALRLKYNRGSFGWNLNSLNSTASAMGFKLCYLGGKWVVGDGSSINFLEDNWSPRGPLRRIVSDPFNLGEENIMVASVRDTGGGWGTYITIF